MSELEISEPISYSIEFQCSNYISKELNWIHCIIGVTEKIEIILWKITFKAKWRKKCSPEFVNLIPITYFKQSAYTWTNIIECWKHSYELWMSCKTKPMQTGPSSSPIKNWEYSQESLAVQFVKSVISGTQKFDFNFHYVPKFYQTSENWNIFYYKLALRRRKYKKDSNSMKIGVIKILHHVKL